MSSRSEVHQSYSCILRVQQYIYSWAVGRRVIWGAQMGARICFVHKYQTVFVSVCVRVTGCVL